MRRQRATPATPSRTTISTRPSTPSISRAPGIDPLATRIATDVRICRNPMPLSSRPANGTPHLVLLEHDRNQEAAEASWKEAKTRRFADLAKSGAVEKLFGFTSFTVLVTVIDEGGAPLRRIQALQKASIAAPHDAVHPGRMGPRARRHERHDLVHTDHPNHRKWPAPHRSCESRRSVFAD